MAFSLLAYLGFSNANIRQFLTYLEYTIFELLRPQAAHQYHQQTSRSLEIKTTKSQHPQHLMLNWRARYVHQRWSCQLICVVQSYVQDYYIRKNERLVKQLIIALRSSNRQIFYCFQDRKCHSQNCRTTTGSKSNFPKSNF